MADAEEVLRPFTEEERLIVQEPFVFEENNEDWDWFVKSFGIELFEEEKPSIGEPVSPEVLTPPSSPKVPTPPPAPHVDEESVVSFFNPDVPDLEQDGRDYQLVAKCMFPGEFDTVLLPLPAPHFDFWQESLTIECMARLVELRLDVPVWVTVGLGVIFGYEGRYLYREQLLEALSPVVLTPPPSSPEVPTEEEQELNFFNPDVPDLDKKKFGRENKYGKVVKLQWSKEENYELLAKCKFPDEYDTVLRHLPGKYWKAKKTMECMQKLQDMGLSLNVYVTRGLVSDNPTPLQQVYFEYKGVYWNRMLLLLALEDEEEEEEEEPQPEPEPPADGKRRAFRRALERTTESSSFLNSMDNEGNVKRSRSY